MLTNMIKYEEIDNLTFCSMLGVLQGGMWLLNDLETYLSDFGISQGRFSILLAVLDSERTPVQPSTLAVQLGRSKPTITKMIEKLINDRLIYKKKSEGDRREKILTLSEKGEELINRIVPGYNLRIQQMSSSLTKVEKNSLLQILSKINYLNSEREIRMP